MSVIRAEDRQWSTCVDCGRSVPLGVERCDFDAGYRAAQERAPGFRKVTDAHPPGRYLVRQRPGDRGQEMSTDGAGSWVYRLDYKPWGVRQPVGHTYGPLPDWPGGDGP